MTLTKINNLLIIAFTVMLLTVICFSLFAPMTTALAAETPMNFGRYLDSIGSFAYNEPYFYPQPFIDSFSIVGAINSVDAGNSVTNGPHSVLSFCNFFVGFSNTSFVSSMGFHLYLRCPDVSKMTFPYTNLPYSSNSLTFTNYVLKNDMVIDVPIVLHLSQSEYSMPFVVNSFKCRISCSSTYEQDYFGYYLSGAELAYVGVSTFDDFGNSATPFYDAQLNFTVFYKLVSPNLSSDGSFVTEDFPVSYSIYYYVPRDKWNMSTQYSWFSVNDYSVNKVPVVFNSLESLYLAYKTSVLSGDTSYTQGYTEGQKVGFSSGQSYGESIGYNNGFAAGVTDANGKVTNSSASYTAGYNAGAEHAGNYTFRSLIGAIIDVPLNAFTSMFNFEILGVNMSALLSSLLVIALVMCVLKIVFSFM